MNIQNLFLKIFLIILKNSNRESTPSTIKQNTKTVLELNIIKIKNNNIIEV